MAKNIGDITGQSSYFKGSNPIGSVLDFINSNYKEYYIWLRYEPRFFDPSDETNRLLISSSAFVEFIGRSKRLASGPNFVLNMIGNLNTEADIIYIYSSMKFFDGYVPDKNDYILQVVQRAQRSYTIREIYLVKDLDIYTWHVKEEYLRATCKAAGTDIDIRSGQIISFDDSGQLVL